MLHEISNRYMTVTETANYLKLHRNVVYAKARSGRLPAVKIGGRLLIDKQRLTKLLELKRRPLLAEMRIARKQRNLSFLDISYRTGISEARLEEIENGAALPRAEELERIWLVLGEHEYRTFSK